MKIADFNLSEGNKTFIIAELSANHNGSLKVALDTIRAAKRAGADAIKLQTYTADTITIDSKSEHFLNIHKGTLWEGKTLYELYKDAYTPWEWHKELFETAKDEGLICFSSPFDKTAVDFLEKFNPPAYKIASFEIQDIPLIEYVASKNKPIIISTGIAELTDINLAVKTCREKGNNQIILLKCTSAYPAPLEEANLKTITNLKDTFQVEVGLSDHTLGYLAPIVAITLGAKVIEKHFIIDKSIGGPDSDFSLDEKEFTEMVSYIRQTEKAIGRIDYNLTDKQLNSKKFGRSLFVVEDIRKGEPFTEKNVRSIRPNFGLHPKYYKEVIGLKAKFDIKSGSPLDISMFDSKSKL